MSFQNDTFTSKSLRIGKFWHGMAWNGKFWHGMANFGIKFHAKTCHSLPIHAQFLAKTCQSMPKLAKTDYSVLKKSRKMVVITYCTVNMGNIDHFGI